MIEFPAFRAAAVQAAPVFLDTPATIDKARALIATAAAEGAELIAFPEVFVSAYPYWNWTMNPVEGGRWFERIYRSAIDVPGPEVDVLCEAARAAGAHIVIGANERDPNSTGTLYNSVLTIGSDGTLLGVHRKLMPTWAEKLTWGRGDGSSIRVHETSIGRLGALACGENTNPLARFALLAQGEQVHVANYIALPVAPHDYDMVEAIKLRAAAHSFEGKVFTVVACSAITDEIVERVAHDDDSRELLRRKHCAFSGVFGPDGRLITSPLVDNEGIVYADIDLAASISAKQMHDVVGHYNRFDVFQLLLDTTPANGLIKTGDVASSRGAESFTSDSPVSAVLPS
ncbi:carbon-nitrogen hydrolase family protein [Amycolatopsis japonica]